MTVAEVKKRYDDLRARSEFCTTKTQLQALLAEAFNLGGEYGAAERDAKWERLAKELYQECLPAFVKGNRREFVKKVRQKFSQAGLLKEGT